MPQLFRIGSYIIYFWINENNPLEPVHVHVASVRPTANATKIWITQASKCLIQNNDSRIPDRELRYIIKIIEARSAEIVAKWFDTFHEISYFC